MKFNWRSMAQCRNTDPNIFVPPEGTRGMGPSLYTKARTYCNSCPVSAHCLEFAIREDIVNGMWGGMTPRERRNYIRSGKKNFA